MTARALILPLLAFNLALGCLQVGQVNECGCTPDLPYLSKNALMLSDYPKRVAQYAEFTFHRPHYQFVNCNEVWMTCDNWKRDLVLILDKTGENLGDVEFVSADTPFPIPFLACNRETYVWNYTDDQLTVPFETLSFGCVNLKYRQVTE